MVFAQSSDTHSGLGGMGVQMLDGLHQQCDVSGGRLVQRFIKQRSLDKCVVEIRNHRASIQGQAQQGSSSLDPRQVGWEPDHHSCVFWGRLQGFAPSPVSHPCQPNTAYVSS